MEQWKPVVGFEDDFNVSDKGNVWNKKKFVLLKRTKHKFEPYESVNLNGTRKLVHILVAEAFLGPKPPGQCVRHGRYGGDDHSLRNLSYGSRRANSAEDFNRDNVCSSRFPGVSKVRNRWQARIRIGGKDKYLGSFEEEQDAAAAYRKAREEIGDPIETR